MSQLIHLSKLLLLYFIPTGTFAAQAIKNKSEGESCNHFPMLTLSADVSFNYLCKYTSSYILWTSRQLFYSYSKSKTQAILF